RFSRDWSSDVCSSDLATRIALFRGNLQSRGHTMDLPFRYVLIGLIWLVVAMIQGLWMGMAGATQYTSLHVLMVLTGGVTGILFRSEERRVGNECSART